jgi:putative ABC transport system substrate-binding protein
VNRRAFIAGLGGAVAWPVAARAQQRWRIGLLSAGGPTPLTDVLISTLGELGYVEGKNTLIERRFGVLLTAIASK